MLDYVSKHAKEYTTTYGTVASASIGAIQRALLELETQGGDLFFGEPAFHVFDLMQTEHGKGVMNVLASDRLLLSPKLYSTFLLWLLSELFDHDYETLRLAVQNTFARRRVSLPESIPEAWTPEFAASPTKTTQWAAFLRKNKMVTAPADFKTVGARVASFLTPVFFPPEQKLTTWKAATGWQ